MDDPEARMEQILGRRLEESPPKFASLNDVPADLVDDARRLPGVLKHLFLQRYFDISARFDIQTFVQDVVDGYEDPRRWQLGRVLYPSFAADELLVRNVPSILAVLDPSTDEKWQRFPPERTAWERRQGYAGAPSVVRPTLDYRWQEPPHVRTFAQSGAGELEPVADIDIATRRWVASRVAGAIPIEERRLAWRDPSELLSSAFPEVVDVSDDALTAVNALLAEEELLSDEHTEIPGFRGPDEWYAGRLRGGAGSPSRR